VGMAWLCAVLWIGLEHWPIIAILILAAGVVLLRAADRAVLLAAVTTVVTALAYRAKLHPLWLLAGGAVLGLVVG
jgi:chromate transporter